MTTTWTREDEQTGGGDQLFCGMYLGGSEIYCGQSFDGTVIYCGQTADIWTDEAEEDPVEA